jgi:DNA-binding MarR family transcriptional regulator
MKNQADLAARLHSASIRLLRRLSVADRSAGTSSARLSALSVLIHAGPQTASSLAVAERLRLPTISRLLKGMEADGLVRRKADASDGRVAWFEASAKGRRLLEHARNKRLAMLAEMLEKASVDERRQLLEAVAVLERLLGPRN